MNGGYFGFHKSLSFLKVCLYHSIQATGAIQPVYIPASTCFSLLQQFCLCPNVVAIISFLQPSCRDLRNKIEREEGAGQDKLENSTVSRSPVRNINMYQSLTLVISFPLDQMGLHKQMPTPFCSFMFQQLKKCPKRGFLFFFLRNG